MSGRNGLARLGTAAYRLVPLGLHVGFRWKLSMHEWAVRLFRVVLLSLRDAMRAG